MPRCGSCGGWINEGSIGCPKCGPIMVHPVRKIPDQIQSPVRSPPKGIFSGILIIIGLIYWIDAINSIDEDLQKYNTFVGIAYACWVGAIVVAIHSVGKYIGGSQKK